MGTRKNAAKPKDDGNGAGNGAGNSHAKGARPRALEFDAFCDAVGETLADLHDEIIICACDEHGRTIGARLGKVALSPLASLDDRIKVEVDGPRVVALKTRTKTGQWGTLVGTFPVPAPRRTASAPDETMKELLAEMRAELKEARKEAAEARAAAARPVEPVERLAEKVDAFGQMTRSIKEMVPAPPPPAPPPPAAKSLKEQMIELKESAELIGLKVGGDSDSKAESVFVKGLELFAPSIGKVFDATAALIAKKAGLGEDEEKKE